MRLKAADVFEDEHGSFLLRAQGASAPLSPEDIAYLLPGRWYVPDSYFLLFLKGENALWGRKLLVTGNDCAAIRQQLEASGVETRFFLPMFAFVAIQVPGFILAIATMSVR